MHHLLRLAGLAVISITASAQLSSEIPNATAVKFEPTKPIVGLHGQVPYPHIQCDGAGYTYIPLVPPDTYRIFPVLHRLSPTGTKQVSFGTNRPGLTLDSIGVAPDGTVVTLPTFGGVTSLLRYNSNGTLKSRVQLSELAQGQIAPFPNGRVLVNFRRKIHAFTSIYDEQGKFVTRVEIPGDDDIEQAIANPDSPNTTNRAVDLGLAVAGPDGNVYLLRSANPPVVFAIDSDGKVIRRLELAPPLRGMLPMNMQIVEGLVILVFDEVGGGRGYKSALTVNDWDSGETLKVLDFTGKPGPLGCYDPTTDRMTYINWDSSSNYQIGFGVAEPGTASGALRKE